MINLHYVGKKFEKRKVPLPDLTTEKVFPNRLQVKAVFAPECKWRLLEEFGGDCFTEREDGRLQIGHTDVLLIW